MGHNICLWISSPVSHESAKPIIFTPKKVEAVLLMTVEPSCHDHCTCAYAQRSASYGHTDFDTWRSQIYIYFLNLFFQTFRTNFIPKKTFKIKVVQGVKPKHPLRWARSHFTTRRHLVFSCAEILRKLFCFFTESSSQFWENLFYAFLKNKVNIILE